MIRRSLFIASVAALLSLLLHLLGIGATVRVTDEPATASNQRDAVELTNAFDDLAETDAEPVEPAAAPEPQPEEAATPAPEQAETSAARIDDTELRRALTRLGENVLKRTST